MITIDLTMPIQIVNILILIVIMNAVLYKPVRNIIEKRRQKIDGLNLEITTFTKNATLQLEEFDNKINQARTQAKAEMESTRLDAQNKSNAQLIEVRKKVDVEKTADLTQIGKEFATAKQELQNQIDGFAGEMAVRIMGRAL